MAEEYRYHIKETANWLARLYRATKDDTKARAWEEAGR